MLTYYVDPRTNRFGVDRRHSGAPVSEDRRQHTITTTDQQYEFLRDCLIRREDHRKELGTKERRARHILVGIMAVFVVLLFATNEPTLKLTAFGNSITLKMVQIIAVAPFLMTYLIVYACTRAARQYRLEQECLALDLALQRFGCPTSYSVVEPIRAYAWNRQAAATTRKFRFWSQLSFAVHDGFLVIGVGLTYTIATVQAFRIFGKQSDLGPLVARGLTGFLLIAAGTATCAVLASWNMRRGRGVVFRDFQKLGKSQAEAQRGNGAPGARREGSVGPDR